MFWIGRKEGHSGAAESVGWKLGRLIEGVHFTSLGRHLKSERMGEGRNQNGRWVGD